MTHLVLFQLFLYRCYFFTYLLILQAQVSVLLNILLLTRSSGLPEHWDGFAYMKSEVIKGRDYIYSFPYPSCLAQWLARKLFGK